METQWETSSDGSLVNVQSFNLNKQIQIQKEVIIMRKTNIKRTFTGIIAATAMAFTVIAPTTFNSTNIPHTYSITANAASISMTNAEYQKGVHIYTYLKNHTSWNDGAICGILTHLYTESRFTPTAVNPKSGAYGVAQWLGSRKADLFKRPNYSNIDVQLDYMIYEINNISYYKYSKEAITKASNNANGAYNTVLTFRANYGWGTYGSTPNPGSQYSDCVERAKEARDFFYSKFAKNSSIENTIETPVNYTVSLAKGTAIYKDAGSSTVNQYLSVAGTYTIIKEKTVNSVKYGYLKSGAGWVKLSSSSSTPVNTGEISVNYTKYLAKGTAIYKDAGSSTVNQYLSAAGTFTITKEKTVNNVKYGYLKSGAGWVKL